MKLPSLSQLQCNCRNLAAIFNTGRTDLAMRHFAMRQPVINRFQATFDRHLSYAKAETLRNLETAHLARIKNVGGGVAADFLFNLDVFSRGLLAGLRSEALAALQEAGDEFFEEIGGRMDPFSMPDPEALQFLAARSQQLAGMPSEIADAVRAEIAAGMNEGESIAQMATRLDSKFDDISKVRGTTIASTETGAVYGAARQSGMLQAGIETKRWLSSGLPNVRLAHSMAENDERNQNVPVDEPFLVDGEELMHPGDPTGSPANVINCHCVAVLGLVERKGS